MNELNPKFVDYGRDIGPVLCPFHKDTFCSPDRCSNYYAVIHMMLKLNEEFPDTRNLGPFFPARVEEYRRTLTELGQLDESSCHPQPENPNN